MAMQGAHPSGFFPQVLFCFPLGLLLPVGGGRASGGADLPLSLQFPSG